MKRYLLIALLLTACVHPRSTAMATSPIRSEAQAELAEAPSTLELAKELNRKLDKAIEQNIAAIEEMERAINEAANEAAKFGTADSSMIVDLSAWQPTSFVFEGEDGTALVTIYTDGTVEWDEDLDVDGASRAFWESMKSFVTSIVTSIVTSLLWMVAT